jgi:hypothetical protein
VKDLIPLYADDLLSSDSVEFIRRHAEHCPECQKTWERAREPLPGVQSQDSTAEKQVIQKALRKDRMKTVLKTILTTLLVLAIPTCYILQTLYEYGFLYDIEASYHSPDGNCTLELVDRDSFSARSDGYLIRFILDRNVKGANRYWTDWDTIEAHWAPDSIHLLLMVTDEEGNPAIHVLNTVTMETQGGTWDIPGLSENLLPEIASLCNTSEVISLIFVSWSDNSEQLTFDYTTAEGETGQITCPRPDIPWKVYD